MRPVSILAAFTIASVSGVTPVLAPTQQRSPTAQRERERVFGRVLTTDGSPWKRASVTLVGRPYPVYVHAGQADEIVVECDDRGRFEAEILPYRRYSAWAHAKGEAGRTRVSRIVDEISPGVPFRLTERPEPVLRTVVRFEGLESWKRYAPFRFRAYTRRWPGTSLSRFLEPATDGELELPAFPNTVLVEIIGKGGIRLWASWIPTTAPEREQMRSMDRDGYTLPAQQDAERPELMRLALPSLEELDVKVTDASGNPIPGATISAGAQDSSGWTGDVFDCAPVAKTGKDGVARVLWPLRFKPSGMLAGGRPSVHVTAHGHGEAFLRALESVKPTIKRDNKTLTVALGEGELWLHGRLVGADGKPLPNVELFLYSTIRPIMATKPFVHRTGPNGRFSIPSLGDSLPCRLTALLPGRSDPIVHEEAYLHFVPRGGAGASDVGTVKTSELSLVTLRVKAAGGGPAERAWVHVGEDDGPRQMVVMRTDRKGLACLRARTGQRLSVLAAGKLSFALARIVVQKQATNVDLTLERGPRVAGRVVDASGEPVASATVRLYQQGIRRAAGTWGTFLEGVFYTSPGLKGIMRSDDEGRFQFAYPFAGLDITIRAWKEIAPRKYIEYDDAPPLKLSEAGVTDLELKLVRDK